MDYEEILDLALGAHSPHTSLRTIFDPSSDEWNRTTIDKKLDMLQRILNTKEISLSVLLYVYRNYYTEELSNKAYVVDAIPDALEILLEHSLLKND